MRVEDLVRRVGLRDGEGLAVVDHAALEVRDECALMRRRAAVQARSLRLRWPLIGTLAQS